MCSTIYRTPIIERGAGLGGIAAPACYERVGAGMSPFDFDGSGRLALLTIFRSSYLQMVNCMTFSSDVQIHEIGQISHIRGIIGLCPATPN